MAEGLTRRFFCGEKSRQSFRPVALAHRIRHLFGRVDFAREPCEALAFETIARHLGEIEPDTDDHDAGFAIGTQVPKPREPYYVCVGMISIVPINAVDVPLLERLALCLEERFLFTCVVERVLRVPTTALNGVRKQMFLNTLVTRVAAIVPPIDGVRLAVTDFDLYKTSHQFIFGDGSEEHRVAIVSSHRLRGEFYGERGDTNLVFQRILKESVHDLGHVFGLKHCFNARCAMYFSNSIYDTDNKLSHFCESCEKRVRANR